MSRLRPCPFCGGEMSEKNFFSCDGYPQACGCWEQTHTGEEAIKVWNTRPIEDRLRNDITGYRRTVLEQHQRIAELENKLADTKRKTQWELNELRESKEKRTLDLLEALAKAIGIADHRSYELEAKTKEAEELAKEAIKLKAELYDSWKEAKSTH